MLRLEINIIKIFHNGEYTFGRWLFYIIIFITVLPLMWICTLFNDFNRYFIWVFNVFNQIPLLKFYVVHIMHIKPTLSFFNIVALWNNILTKRIIFIDILQISYIRILSYCIIFYIILSHTSVVFNDYISHAFAIDSIIYCLKNDVLMFLF